MRETTERAPGLTARSRFWREALETLLGGLLLLALTRLFVQNYRVEGPSMEPTLHEGQFLLVNKVAYLWGEVKHGDVVVFHHPYDSKRDLIKRVIALPGDRLQIVRGQVWINGQPLNEAYILEPAYCSRPSAVIEAGHVFVLGDNRNNSGDSQMWGSVPIRNLIGKPFLCYWPPRHWGLLTRF